MPTANFTNEITVEDRQWLISDESAKKISDVRSAIENGTEMSAVLKSLRKEHTVARSQLLLQQALLRTRAMKKFRLADQMFFTEKGLQQSSGDLIADYKSSKFAELLPNSVAVICDLCCGIGGDAMALADKMKVVGVDQCATTACFAAANLSLVGSKHSICCEDAGDVNVSEFNAWHIDPDQRVSGRRSRDVASLSPGLDVIERLLKKNRNGFVKLSPTAQLPRGWIAEHGPAEIEFVGDHRECRQQIVWFGEANHSTRGVRKTATILSRNSPPVTFRCEQSCEEEGFSLPRKIAGINVANVKNPEAGCILFEPRATVIAAELVDQIALQEGLARIECTVDYLIGSRNSINRPGHPMLVAFEVIDICMVDRKQVRKMLARHNALIVEFKKRGVDHQLMESFRTLKPAGEIPFTLVITRTIQGRRALLARRVQSEPTVEKNCE